MITHFTTDYQFLENILCDCETGWFYPDSDSFEEITAAEALYRWQLRTPKPQENPSFVEFLKSKSFIITDEGELNCFRVTDGNIDMFVSSFFVSGVFGIDIISERAEDTGNKEIMAPRFFEWVELKSGGLV